MLYTPGIALPRSLGDDCLTLSLITFQVCIVKLKMDKDRKGIIDRRAKGRAEATGKDKGKYTEESAAAMETSA